MKPFDKVRYVTLDENDAVTGVWTTNFAAFETLPGNPLRVLVPNDLRVALGDTLDTRRMAVAKKAPLRTAAPPEPKLTFQEKRAAAYPPLNEFAEAFTEKELGDDTKWLHYLKAVKKVRATIRKP